MRTVLVIASRSFGRMFGHVTFLFAAAAFLAAAGALFANGLFGAEGTATSLPSIWAVAVAQALPVIVSVLPMRLWREDGDPGSMDNDLVVPVLERDFAIGRFLAAYAIVAILVAVSLAVPLAVLPACAPALASGLSVSRFVPAFVALSIFAMPLVAIGSLAGVLFRSPAAAAVATAAAVWAVPHAAYRALSSWIPAVRTMFPESPVVSHLSDAADGFFPSSVVVASFAVTVFAVYAASKAFAVRRLAGDGRVSLKMSSAFAVLSSLLAAVMLSALAFRLDFAVEWPGAARSAAFSARTREILSGISAPVRATVCMRRDSRKFAAVTRLFRAISAESRSMAGAGVTCEFVDPRWDPNAAARLMRGGAGEDTIVFASGRRRISIPVKDADERSCASAIQRLSMPAKSASALFTAGHGEPDIEDFSMSGLGEAARALRQDGYSVDSLFTPTSGIPRDCAVLVVAGARTPFSARELRDVGAFMAQGGRLLVAVSGDSGSGVDAILSQAGMRATAAAPGQDTTDGADFVAATFGDHEVSRSLEGTAVVFAPGSMRFDPQGDRSAEADGYVMTPLCMAGDSIFATAAEKGASLGRDLAIRPSRIVAIGDPSFLMNGFLTARANANMDLFLNSMAWLAGIDFSGATSAASDVLSMRMSRARRIRLLALSSVAVPMGAFLLGLALKMRRRGRRR